MTRDWLVICGSIIMACIVLKRTIERFHVPDALETIMPEPVQHQRVTDRLGAARNSDPSTFFAVYADRVKPVVPANWPKGPAGEELCEKSNRFPYAPAPCKPPKVYAIRRYDKPPAEYSEERQTSWFPANYIDAFQHPKPSEIGTALDKMHD